MAYKLQEHKLSQRLTQRQKNANDKQWYKDQAEMLNSRALDSGHFLGYGGISQFKRKKVNYDLFNNIINVNDFRYVVQPFGVDSGKLPANFTNRDILSTKIKVLLGMKMRMPFSWSCVATNREATTRKEQEETRRIKDFVSAQVMNPIEQGIRQQMMAQTKGRELTQQEINQLEQEIAQQTEAQTPDEVRKYMTREHQDPAEVLGEQLTNYIIKEEKVRDKFNKEFKHLMLVGEGVLGVGILNGRPSLSVVNSLHFDYDMSPDLEFIQDGEWATYEWRATPSHVISDFGSHLTNDEIDRIYDFNSGNRAPLDVDFSFDSNREYEPYTVPVKHFTWKSLRKIYILSYLSEQTGEIEEKIVDENYVFKAEYGDIAMKEEWIPECHQVYKILNDIYVLAGPVPGQFKDLSNLYRCKLPYYGIAIDNLNSPVTAPMDRGKSYQYLYDIIIYRMELLMASDEGKKLMININAIPKSLGIDTKKFLYFLKANNIGFLNPAEEGNRTNTDVTNLVKEVDMSIASKINEYIQMAEYIDRKCGASMGVTPQMEAQISSNDPVRNTQQNLIQSSYIIQPYFEAQNALEGEVLTGLLETAKVAYSQNPPGVLSYVLDDMTYQMIVVDKDLLDSSSYGIYMANNPRAFEAKQTIEQLGHAAMQAQQADLSDILKVTRAESITEAEELLETAEAKKANQLNQADRERNRIQEEMQARQEAFEERQWQHEERMIVLKESERRKTELQKQAMLSAGFNEDKDIDDDGEIDVMEIYRDGRDAQIQERKQALDERKFEHQKQVDKDKIELDRKKVKQQFANKNKPKSS